MPRPDGGLRIFVPSAAALLTDHAPHGEGLYAWALLTALAGRGHRLVVCAPFARLNAEPPFELVVVGRGSRFESIAPFGYARAVERVLREHGGASRFDVAHWLFPGEGEEAVFAPPTGLPFVLGPRPEPWPAPAHSRRLRKGDLVRHVARPLLDVRHDRALDAATVVLVQTPRAAELVAPRHRSKIRALPLAVDTDRFQSEPPRGQRIAFVGKLEPEKGVRELVEAFAVVHDRLPEATLVLAGEGSLAAWVAAERRPGLELLGPVGHSEVPALYRDASLLCLPSRGEPFGMAILEAMAAGRAVVAGDGPGPRLLVDERGGRIVEPGDVTALSRALLELLLDPELLSRMGRFNRARVESEYSLAGSVSRLEHIYEQIAFARRAA